MRGKYPKKTVACQVDKVQTSKKIVFQPSCNEIVSLENGTKSKK